MSDDSLRADCERLADIGDLVLTGTPIELFDLGEYELRFVLGYCRAGVDTYFDAPERVLPE